VDEMMFTQLCAAYERVEFAKLILRIGVRLIAYSVVCFFTYVAVVRHDTVTLGHLCSSAQVTGVLSVVLGLIWLETGLVIIDKVWIAHLLAKRVGEES